MTDLEVEIKHLRKLVDNYKKAVDVLKAQRNKYIIMYSILANSEKTTSYQKDAMAYEDLQLDRELNREML